MLPLSYHNSIFTLCLQYLLKVGWVAPSYLYSGRSLSNMRKKSLSKRIGFNLSFVFFHSIPIWFKDQTTISLLILCRVVALLLSRKARRFISFRMFLVEKFTAAFYRQVLTQIERIELTLRSLVCGRFLCLETLCSSLCCASPLKSTILSASNKRTKSWLLIRILPSCYSMNFLNWSLTSCCRFCLVRRANTALELLTHFCTRVPPSGACLISDHTWRSLKISTSQETLLGFALGSRWFVKVGS